jgi:PKD domain
MKHAITVALPAVLLLALLVGGCNDESVPEFTRLVVNPSCGVMPLEIDGFAAVSGGNESGDPTGGNNNLEMTWDFGDGTTGQTSIAYHIYDEPGTYNVRVTATDPDGQTAEISTPVVVRADTLTVEAASNFHGEFVNAEDEGRVTTGQQILFNLFAESCDIDPTNDEHYRNLTFVWHMNDSADRVYYSRNPIFSYDTAGEYDATVAVTHPALAATRKSTLHFVVTDP